MKQHGTVLVTGSLGLLGSAVVRLFAPHAERVVGIDNNSRKGFFGSEGSVVGNLAVPDNKYHHQNFDILNENRVNDLFCANQKEITAVIHCAAQPAHDYSAAHPLEDFRVNALGTLHVLEAARRYCPEAPFVFASTSKVYGDAVNRLPLRVKDKRFVVDQENEHARGILEHLSIDHSMHSPYGAGKASADLYVQEYGRYYGMRVACFRPGTITGPDHAAVELHGFLAYLIKCCATGRSYTVNGYGGYQVRDVIHADDLARAFSCFIDDPTTEPFVTNFGGGMHCNVSMLEAIELAEQATGKKMSWSYSPNPRKGDHVWYIGSCKKFHGQYGEWIDSVKVAPETGTSFTCKAGWRGLFKYDYTLQRIVEEIADRHKVEGRVSG